MRVHLIGAFKGGASTILYEALILEGYANTLFSYAYANHEKHYQQLLEDFIRRNADPSKPTQ